MTPFLESDEFFLLMDNPYAPPPNPMEFVQMPYKRYRHIDEDGLRRLHDVGIRTTLPFQCIWKEIEPEPGKLDWRYLDEYVERAHRVGMKTILFTPTHGYPDWMPDEYFIQTKSGVNRCALSPWNDAAIQASIKFSHRMMQRYYCDYCMVVSSQLSVGETVLINEPAFYDPMAVASYQHFADTDTLPDPAEPLTNEWLLQSYLRMLVDQQSMLAQNRWNEIFLMLHPAIADMGYYGNGNNWIQEILTELTRKIPNVKINHIYYTWIQWQQYWGVMNYWRTRFNENVFGGAEYAEGLPITTPNAIQQGLRGQIISPCYPGIHDNGVEDWMVNNIRDAQRMWENAKK